MELTARDLDELTNRFFSFYDSIVIDVNISTRPRPITCKIVVECQDNESESGWSRVCFDVQDVKEFRFAYGKTSFLVLSSGIQFGWRDGRIYVVLDAYPDDGPELPNLATNNAYVAGRSCEWSVTPIP